MPRRKARRTHGNVDRREALRRLGLGATSTGLLSTQKTLESTSMAGTAVGRQQRLHFQRRPSSEGSTSTSIPP